MTQSYYRKAQCVLLAFNLYNEESFNNLNKWHSDTINYCKNQDNNFAIVLVGLKSNPNNSNRIEKNRINLELVEKFQQEKKFIIGYCEIDLAQKELDNSSNNSNNSNNTNLKEPFELLLEHYAESKFVSNNINLNLSLKNSMENPVYENRTIISSKNLKNTQMQHNLKSTQANEREKICCVIL